MTTGGINYRNLYFKYKALARVHGEPTFTSLHKLLLELKANAFLVPTTLGGRSHGFIIIIISLSTYDTLSPFHPFVVPIHPGALLNQQGTQYEISLVTTLHAEALHNFQTYQLVQRSLVQQVLGAIDSKYQTALRNGITGQVPAEIRVLILHFFLVYGKNHSPRIESEIQGRRTSQT